MKLRVEGHVKSWVDDSLCSQIDPEIWFPEPNQYMLAKNAIALCQSCPVIKECFDYAVKENVEYGVWGGKDFTIRRVEVKYADEHEGGGDRPRVIRTRVFER